MLYVTATNENPYTKTDKLNVWTKPVPNKNWKFWVGGGVVGAAILGSMFLLK